jgi:hypothetical protein
VTETKKQAKDRHIASRRALTPKNIIELSIAECAKVLKRRHKECVKTLQTKSEYLTKVFVANPKKD